MTTLRINATEPQAKFHALQCKYPAFIAGFGSGKSETMLNQAIIDASHSKEALIALYEPTYDLVRLILAPRLQAKLTEMGIPFRYNKSENIIYTEHPQFGNFILRTLDNPARIVGYESYRAHIDEIDTLKEEHAREAWNMIVARNRQKFEGSQSNRVCAYSTPEGFNFVYNRWVKGSSDDYQMVQAATTSNPFLPEDYIDSLRATYPEELIEAYLEGKFVNLTSGTVYRSFNREAHRSSETIRDKETLYIGCDFNVTKQAATIWVKRAGGHEWHAVDELTDMYDTPEMISIIKERYAGHKIVIYPDASGKSRKTVDASISDIGLLQQAGFEVRARKVNPLVKDRILAMNVGLDKGRVYVNDLLCPTVANCLEQQAYDKNGQPDKAAGVDHQNDATTYPIAYEMPIRKPVAAIPFSFAV